MAPPRTRLGGPFGGGSIVPRNELDILPVIDALQQGATTSIRNAFMRKRQQQQDKIAADEKARAIMLEDQERIAREQDRQAAAAERAAAAAHRAAQLKLQQDKLTADAAVPKAPVRGTPEYEAALERETQIRVRNAAPRAGANPLDRQIDQARRDVPRIRPIGARERITTDPLTGQQRLRPPLDPAAAQSFVQDSTGKALRLRSLLQQRGDVPADEQAPPSAPIGDPAAAARAQHRQEIQEIQARNGGVEEIKAANERLRSALMGQAAPTLPPGMQPQGQPQGQAGDPVQSAVQWIRLNPQLPNETDEMYKARYRAATGQ